MTKALVGACIPNGWTQLIHVNRAKVDKSQSKVVRNDRSFHLSYISDLGDGQIDKHTFHASFSNSNEILQYHAKNIQDF